MESSTIFDDVFRTMLEKMPQLAVPLINEVFGTSYPEDVKIIQKRNEHQTKNGRIITDSHLLIANRIYHIECQSTDDSTMVIRMIEYDFAISLEQVQKENGRYRMYFPQSCVLYLRGIKKRDTISVEIVMPNGDTVEYTVPVVQVQEFTCDDMLRKHLLFLLPYHVIKYEQEKELEAQRRHCKEVMFDYNNTRPSENVKKKEILKGILGHCTDRVFIESPVHMSYGNHVHLGDQFYANFNLVIIDDMDVYIGNQVMIGPNVTICTTGHPVYPLYREMGAHYSLPIHIGNKVWIGANSVVLPGVTIGENSVIGAGSIVTRDIPANVVAVGNPCRVLREITETDREYYFRDMKVDFPYTLREEG